MRDGRGGRGIGTPPSPTSMRIDVATMAPGGPGGPGPPLGGSRGPRTPPGGVPPGGPKMAKNGQKMAKNGPKGGVLGSIFSIFGPFSSSGVN